MNAQESRILTATCMYDSRNSMAHCLFNIRSIELHTLHLNRVLIARPGPNMPLNLPIIQIIILHLSTPLFKRKLPKKADKMQMKHEYDQNVHVYFGQRVLVYMQIFSLLYVLRLKELLALPKMIDD